MRNKKNTDDRQKILVLRKDEDESEKLPENKLEKTRQLLNLASEKDPVRFSKTIKGMMLKIGK